MFCLVQITEESKIGNYNDQTKLWPVYASDNILVRKEEIAFPLDSLVADIGGILGLFLGFNFLMIWELMMDFALILVCKAKNERHEEQSMK